MNCRIKSTVAKLRNEARVYKEVMADPRCPRSSKWLIGAALAYAVSPIDLIPDFIPVIGHLDDILVVSLLLGIALKKLPKEIVLEHRAKLAAVIQDNAQQELL